MTLDQPIDGPEPGEVRRRRSLRQRLGLVKLAVQTRLERLVLRARGVRLHSSVVLANVRFRGPAVVEACCRLKGNPRIEIGRGAYLAPHVHIQGDVELGPDVWIGPRVVMWGRDHGLESGIPIRSQPHRTEPIRVEERVRIGAGAILLRGVRVGAGAIVGAGSVCTASVPPGARVRGAPARGEEG